MFYVHKTMLLDAAGGGLIHLFHSDAEPSAIRMCEILPINRGGTAT